MSFSYDAGTSTPNLAGLAEIGSIRVNDGTFVLTRCGRLVTSPRPRSVIAPLPSDHGGSVGTPFYDPMTFPLEGYLTVPVLDDVWGAIDLLLETFNLENGLQTLTLDTGGWSATRQIDVMLDGEVQIVEPTMLAKKVPDRDFTVGLIAPDPRLYATTEQSVTVTTATSLTNNGTAATPFTVRFNGPRTNPYIDGPGTAGTNRIRYSGAIASGHWVEVTTNPATETGVTAVDDTGANVYGSLTNFTARTIAPGSSSWTVTSDSGTGTVTVKFRDAWA